MSARQEQRQQTAERLYARYLHEPSAIVKRMSEYTFNDNDLEHSHITLFRHFWGWLRGKPFVAEWRANLLKRTQDFSTQTEELVFVGNKPKRHDVAPIRSYPDLEDARTPTERNLAAYYDMPGNYFVFADDELVSDKLGVRTYRRKIEVEDLRSLGKSVEDISGELVEKRSKQRSIDFWFTYDSHRHLKLTSPETDAATPQDEKLNA